MAVRVVSKSFEVKTSREGEMLDITDEVQEAVSASGVSDGLATVFVTGSTAAVTTIEFEPGLLKDFPAMMDRAVPKSGVRYDHDMKWHDGNGHSHVKASLVGPSLTVPVVGGRASLGEWQQVVLAEFDVRPRVRSVIVQVIGG